jgi:DNA-binding NtrC family response regulator
LEAQDGLEEEFPAGGGARPMTDCVEMEEVSLILCDVRLCGETGPTLVKDLLRQFPHTVALIMSESA